MKKEEDQKIRECMASALKVMETQDKRLSALEDIVESLTGAIDKLSQHSLALSDAVEEILQAMLQESPSALSPPPRWPTSLN